MGSAHGSPAGRSTPAGEAGELAELLSRSARILNRGSVAGLSPLGLTYGQARLLRLLAGAARAPRMAELAARLDVVPRAATTMVDGAQQAGLVRRLPDPGDRRSVLVELTSQGRRLLGRIAEARRATAETVFGPLSPAQRADLLDILRIICGPGSSSAQRGD